jgi:hypothetical protein
MNRAWIPAGALAGVSVAGLLALGPLTDSMGTPVAFPEPVTIAKPTANDFRPVSVTVDGGTVGSLQQTASLRGGRATSTAPPNSDVGYVSYSKTAAVVKAAKNSSNAKTTVKSKKKKPVNRNVPIGGAAEMNSSAGLASGQPSGQRADGEQASNLTGNGN